MAYEGEKAGLPGTLQSTAPPPKKGRRSEPGHSARQFENSAEAELSPLKAASLLDEVARMIAEGRL